MNVNPAPDAVTVYTPPGLEGAKKLMDRPIPVPVTALATVMGDPPTWGVSITDTDGAGTPAVKPLAVMLIGVFGLAVLGSMFISVIFCAYTGVNPSAASRNVRKTTPRSLRIAGKDLRWMVGNVLRVSGQSGIDCKKYCRIIAFPYYSLQGISYGDRIPPRCWDRIFPGDTRV